MSPEMRDEVYSIARELQRRKTSKHERITANTIMRVATRLFSSQFDAEHFKSINTEDELFSAARPWAILTKVCIEKRKRKGKTILSVGIDASDPYASRHDCRTVHVLVNSAGTRAGCAARSGFCRK